MAVPVPAAGSRGGVLGEKDDPELIRSSLDGDERSTEELIRRYWDQAARSALLIIGDEHLAEDAAQEAFISVLGSLKKFDPERPFGPWVHRIAVNKAIDRARKAGRQPALIEDPETRAPGSVPEADSGAEVLEAMAGIAVEDRALLVARYVLGYRATEIAEWFGVPAATVRVRIHRAAERVRGLVGEGGDDGAGD